MNNRTTFSPEVKQALELLRNLDWANLQAGADMRAQAVVIVRAIPFLADWYEKSEELRRNLKGAVRLRRRRRLGILRHVTGPLLGLPFLEPPVYPSTSAPEWRLKPLWDELELALIYGRTCDGIWRPAKDELNFDEARAFLEMRSGTLYRLTCKGLVPGVIRRELRKNGVKNDGSRSYMRGLRFRTLELVYWSRSSSW